MVTCSLEEGREIKSHPVKSECETILEAGKGVAEDLLVTRIINGILTYGKLVVSVKIDIFQVTGKETSGHTAIDDAAVKNILCIFLCLLVCLEQTIDLKAPDVTKTLSFVIVGQNLILVIELGDV